MELVESVARAIIRGRASDGDALGPPLRGKKLTRYVDSGVWKYWTGDAERAIATVKAHMENAVYGIGGPDAQGTLQRAICRVFLAKAFDKTEIDNG